MDLPTCYLRHYATRMLDGERDFGRHTNMTSYSRRSLLTAASALPFIPFSSAFADHHGGGKSLKGRFYKTLKIGMVKEGKTLTEKFAAAKEAGFEGIELGLPGNNVAEAKQAIADAGLPVDGSVCAGHWGVRHSDPDETVRAEALKTLIKALHETHEVGGSTVLLVVGKGADGTEKEVWDRSVANIRKALPVASKLGVSIAVENVWNQFCYDHDGAADQSAEKFVKYIDEFNSPFIGMQFDIGNHWKYGSMGDWIRQLNKRIIKLDVKGYNRAEGAWAHIGKGDIDFADVRKALVEINFHGWCAAEVGGGDLARLKEVSANMDKAFGLV